MFNIPCVLMRGGTSKGPVILASDLPADTQERDAVLLSLMGAGHELEIDGIGGGSPQTSKVAIVSRSDSPDADIDYLFAQDNEAITAVAENGKNSKDALSTAEEEINTQLAQTNQ